MKHELKLNSIDIVMIGLLIVIAVFFGIIGIVGWAFLYGFYLLIKASLRLKGAKKGFIKTDFLLMAIFIIVIIICIGLYFLDLL